MSEWTTQRLEEIIQVNPTVKLTKGEVYPFIDIDKVSPTLRSVTNEEEKVYDGQSCSKFCNGDTVFSRITPCLENRKIAKVSIDGQSAFGSTEFYVFRAKEGKSDENYVYYLTSSDAVVLPAINSMTGASGRQRADRRFIERTKLNVPDLPTQKRIADILSAYDDLIENNNRRIALLEKAAQELYREWFVRFRFPGYENAKFENGLPEGWETLKLSQISDFVYGKMPNANLVSDVGYPIFSGYRVSGYYPEYMFEDKKLVLIARGVGGTGDVKLSPPKAYITNLAIVFLLKNNIYQQYLYYTYSLSNLRYLDTGAAQSQITIENLRRVKVVCPQHTILEKFNNYVLTIDAQIQNLLDKNNNLAKQRDLLLPRLMSGKLEV